MSQSQRIFDILLRAVATATNDLELADIRALAASSNHHRLAELDRAIEQRKRQLAAIPPSDG